MIKKIIPLLLIFMICGCSNRISLNNQLKELGYSRDDIDIISKYEYEDVKQLYVSYNKPLLKILKDKRCNPSKIKDYIWYHTSFDTDTMFKLVNGNYLKKDSGIFFRELVKQKYFILDNLDKYVEYSKQIEDMNHLIGYVNAKAYRKPYVEYLNAKTDDEMAVLANKWNFLDKYEPSNLIVIDKKYGLAKYEQKLKQETYTAFIKMYEAAKKDKINLYITSAYRGYDYQIKIYNEYLLKDPQEAVDTYSSRPGYSDHQTGLACDILSYGYNFDTFESSQAFKWLSDNASKYGFILRYPKDKEDITGYIYESWHYRYVGEGLAEYIKDNNLTYEEYYAFFTERGKTYESS